MDSPTSPPADREPIPSSPPEDPTVLATLDWVVAFFDRHLVALGEDLVVPAMSVAYALGFAGATREQVWWVLREVRLRTVMASLLSTMRRLPPTELPAWSAPITAQPPATRRQIAEEARAQADVNPTTVPRDRAALYAACAAHPDAARSEDGTSIALPYGVLDEVARIARSISFSDILRLVDVARDPVARRLHEAALVSEDAATTYHLPPKGTSAA